MRKKYFEERYRPPEQSDDRVILRAFSGILRYCRFYDIDPRIVRNSAYTYKRYHIHIVANPNHILI